MSEKSHEVASPSSIWIWQPVDLLETHGFPSLPHDRFGNNWDKYIYFETLCQGEYDLYRFCECFLLYLSNNLMVSIQIESLFEDLLLEEDLTTIEL